MTDNPQPQNPGSAGPDRRLIDAARRQAEEALRRSTGKGAPPLPGVGDGSPRGEEPLETRHDAAADEPFSVAIPGYEMIREIHRGGQGVVYLAVQQSTRRRVAVKIMREGPFGSRGDRTRFEREVHILGQLQHPNIVTIHESGTTAGHFYFVMDYISGHSLDEYRYRDREGAGIAAEHDEATERQSDGGDQYRGRKSAGVAKGTKARHSPIIDTLRLFAKICDAVHAAHLRGVIHRDLKPSNIRIDADGEPHVLDFGLAKFAFDSAVIDNRQSAIGNVPTLTGQFIGSLPWSSPEQAEGAHGKMDVRTDVYALGVILYHMLTGRFPYSVVGNMRDVLDNVLNAEPTRPGTLRREIDDEVETLVLKCLQKERDRRYQSAGELARDVRHYLAGEPLDAKRDSGWYLLKKSFRRHRAAAYTTLAFVVLISVAAVATSVLFFQARTEARKAEKINAFLQRMLAAADPFEQKGPDITVREILDEASQSLQTDFSLEPAVQADVHATLGNTYGSLSLFDKAEPHLRAALVFRKKLYGEQHAEVAASLHDLGYLLLGKGDLAAAEPMLREALAMRRKTLGPENSEVATTLSKLGSLLQDKGDYDNAVSHYGEALDIRRKVLGESHELVASDMNNLALCLLDKGDTEMAVTLFKKALDVHRARLGAEHPYVAADLNNLGMVLVRQGDYAAAESLFREALSIDRKRLGDEHAGIATDLNNLVAVLHAQGAYKTAEPLAHEALSLRQKLLGEEHPEVAQSLGNLASILHALGDYDEADPLFRQALDQYRKLLAPEHPAVAATMNNLARLLTEKGDFATAEPLAREALAMRRKLLGHEDPQVAMSLNDLANLLTAKAAFSAAKSLYDEALAIRSKTLGEDHPHVAQTLNDLAHWYLLQSEPGAPATGPHSPPSPEPRAPALYAKCQGSARAISPRKEAESLYRQALEIRRKRLPSNHPDLATTMVGLATTILEAEGKQTVPSDEHPQIVPPERGDHRGVISAEKDASSIARKAEAASLLKEALEIRRKSLREGDPRIAAVENMLNRSGVP